MRKREQLLGIPLLYQAFQYLVGKFGISRLNLFSKYLPYTSGVRVLDLGCGPGTCSYLFRSQDYIGIDIDDSYISFARKKYPNHHFEVYDFCNSTRASIANSSFDLVFAYGLFHHLDDKTAETFFLNSFDVLKPGGRMVCFDGCLHESQSRISRFTTLADRGQFIRYPSHLQALASDAGFITNFTLEESPYLIPYSLVVLSLLKGD